MKELQLREIQQMGLKVLKHVHSFCDEHSIKYSLAYGTLIGAVRHRGFIPWDDDIDIVMPRPEFDRFCQTFTSNDEYKLIAPKDSYLQFARVCDIKHTIAKTTLPWSNQTTGVWIDIFPLDGVAESKEDFLKEIEPLYNIAKIKRRIRRGRFQKLSLSLGFKEIFNCLSKRLNYRKYDFDEINLQHEKIMKKYPFDGSKYIGQLSCLDDPASEHHLASDFCTYTKLTFEDSEFMAIAGYDNFLTNCYGDYMQLPPEDKRVPNGESKIKFYWKE